MGAFYLFPRVGASQAREFQIATTTTTTPPRKTVQATFCTVICIFFYKIFQKCAGMFLQCFPSKHAKTLFFFFLQCFQFPCLHKPLKTPLFTLFSSIFPCSNAAGQLKHIYKQSFKNIVFFLQCFYNVFRQKHRNLHVFRHKVGPKHWFLQCFQCSGIQKPFKISLFTIYSVFSFLSVLPLPEAYQNDPQIPFQYPLKLRHPKIVEKSRKHHLILVLVRNR